MSLGLSRLSFEILNSTVRDGGAWFTVRPCEPGSYDNQFLLHCKWVFPCWCDLLDMGNPLVAIATECL